MVADSPLAPSVALVAYVESVVEGRRVVVFGNASSQLVNRLVERGARFIQFYDADPLRVADASARNGSSSVCFSALQRDSLSAKEGVFDLALVENLAELGEPEVVLRLVRRVLSARGIAVVACPNPDVQEPFLGESRSVDHQLDYYSLYDATRREFPVVHMLGQMPFLGYSLAELAPSDDPVPTIDAGFVPGGTEEPEWFVAIATTQPIDLAEYLIVQLPLSEFQKGRAERSLREQLRAARAAERAAVTRLARLEATKERGVAEARLPQPDRESIRQLHVLERELERKEAWIAQLESRAATADARADAAEQELDELRERMAAGAAEAAPGQAEEKARCDQLERESQAVQSRVDQVTAELAAARSQNEQLDRSRELAEQRSEELAADIATGERRFDELRRGLAAAELAKAELGARLAAAEERILVFSEEDPQQQAEIGSLERQLSERGQRIQKLEEELLLAQRLGRRLVDEIANFRRAAPPAGALSTDSWAMAAAFDEATSTEQNPAQDANWAAAPPPELDADGPAADETPTLGLLLAEARADLGVAKWREAQLTASLAQANDDSERAKALAEQLREARDWLQKTEVLIHQLRPKSLTDGPDR